MNPMLKSALELGPILVFVALINMYNIHVATYVFVVLAPITMFITWKMDGSISPIQWIGTLIIVISGMATILTGDSRFIKMKPTIVSAFFAVVLGYAFFAKKLWLKKVLGSQLEMPDDVWLKLTIRWAMYFAAIAIANEFAWRYLSDGHWGYFKIALIPISLIFGISQAPLMMKYMKVDETK
ncbi:MAG: inner membrane-spanning protein YciB [Alphaproteobacteria bacterium]